MAEGGDIDDWKPPSEAEMKVINARRERQNKISKIMGEYLLKGYKMLNSICSLCGTILLQDREGGEYCVSCRELTSDTDKDDPVVNPDAAESQVREGLSQATTEHSVDADSGLHYVDMPPEASHSLPTQQPMPNITAAAGRLLAKLQQGSSHDADIEVGSCLPSTLSKSSIVTETTSALQSRLHWANSQLLNTTQSDQIITLCSVIEKCVSAIKAVQSLNNAS